MVAWQTRTFIRHVVYRPAQYFHLKFAFQLSVVAEGKPTEDTCDRLLALERDLDSTMLR